MLQKLACACLKMTVLLRSVWISKHMLMIVQAGDYWHAWMWLLLWYDLAKICAIIWNDCAIKLYKHMNWLCNVITPIWAKHIEQPPSGYTLNMETSKAWLSKHLCNHQMIVHSYCANIVIVQCSETNMNKESEHPPFS